jgi:hypothetical protein
LVAENARLTERTMNPVGQATIVDFLEWIKRSHPEVRSLKGLPKSDFMVLAIQYEALKGVEMSEDSNLYRKWESTHWQVSERSDTASL